MNKKVCKILGGMSAASLILAGALPLLGQTQIPQNDGLGGTKTKQIPPNDGLPGTKTKTVQQAEKSKTKAAPEKSKTAEKAKQKSAK